MSKKLKNSLIGIVILFLLVGCNTKSKDNSYIDEYPNVEFKIVTVKSEPRKYFTLESYENAVGDLDYFVAFDVVDEDQLWLAERIDSVFDVVGDCLVINEFAGETVHFKSRKYPLRRVYKQSVEYNHLNFIDLRTGESIDKQDLKKIVVDDFDSNFANLTSVEFLFRGGEHLIEARMVPKVPEKVDLENYDQGRLQDVYFDTSTLTVSHQEYEFPDIPINDSTFRSVTAMLTRGSNMGKINGLGDIEVSRTTNDGNQYFTIKISPDNLPEANPMLYERFPKLKELKGRSKTELYITIHSEETEEEILRLFLEEDSSLIYDGVNVNPVWYPDYTLKHDDSVDVEINSYQDFLDFLSSRGIDY